MYQQSKIAWHMNSEVIPGKIWAALCEQAIAIFYNAMQDGYPLSDGSGNLPLVSKDKLPEPSERG